MKNKLCPYQMLDDEMCEKIGIELEDYEFFYTENNKLEDIENDEFQIVAEYDGITQSTSNRILLSTKNSNYNSDVHNLKIRSSIVVNYPNFLFGINGLAHPTTILGLAIAWNSKSSSQRGVAKIGTITSNDSKVNYPIKLDFNEGQINGEIEINIIIYVQKCTNNDAFYFASKAGSVIGTIDTVNISVDGGGSTFPIVSIDTEPNKPLWWLDINWVNPAEDLFNSDNVRICINKLHRDFILLDMDEGGIATSPYLREIVANALSMIISVLKSDNNSWDCMMNNDFEEGSVCAAVKYFIDTFNWKYDSVHELSYSIRKQFDSIQNMR